MYWKFSYDTNTLIIGTEENVNSYDAGDCSDTFAYECDPDNGHPNWSGGVYRRANYVVITGDLKPDSMAYWFWGLFAVEHIYGLENLDTSQVRAMQGLFAGCSDR